MSLPQSPVRRAATSAPVVPCRQSPPVGEQFLRDNEAMSFDRTFDESALFRICFVCTGNICRSPMAETIFKALVKRAGFEKVVAVISAGTGDWHVGEPSDDRTLAALAGHGYNGSGHRARQFDPAWFANLDLVVVFDRSQERILKAWASSEQDSSKVQLLLSFDSEQSALMDVPDPYYSDAALFDQVLVMIEKACAALFRQIKPGIRQGVA
ncbi:MAG: protein tyrosine phosphatase [Rhodoglobus sp.]|nr:protein tyrosine phosphatase [Rhodoglobus sp.]